MLSQKLKNALLWVVRIGFWIIPFIPLYVSRSLFFPYITGKAFLFRTIVEIAFGAWVVLASFYQEYRPRRTPLMITLSIFIFIVSLATLFGVNPVRAFWSNFERMEGLVTYLHLFLYFLVITHVFRKSDWIVFFNLFIVSGVFEILYALAQRLGIFPSPQGGFRVDGTIGNPTYLAAYLIFLVGIAGLMWLWNRDNKIKYVYITTALFALLVIYFTASRGPVLAFLIGLFIALSIYLIVWKPKNSQEIKRRFWLGIVLGVVIVVPLTLGLLHNTQFVKSTPNLDRLTSLSFKEKTIASRFTIWSMGLDGVKERPILGWGPEAYPAVFAKYYRPELWPQEPWFDRSHNIVFDWLINAGIVGFLSYISIFIVAIFCLFKLYREQRVQLEILLLFSTLFFMYFLQNFFVFDNIATYISFFSILAWINSISGDLPVSIQKETPIRWASVFSVVGVLISVLMIYYVNWRPLQTNLHLLNAIKVFQEGKFENAYSDFQAALANGVLGRTEAREQLVRYAVAVGSVPQASDDLKDRALRRAIAEAENNVRDNALDPRSHLFLATIYGKVGLTDNAIQVLEEALKVSPKKQQIYFEMLDIYLQQQEFGNGVEVAQRAFELDKEFGVARMNLAAAYILNNQQKEADQLLIEKYKTADVADILLVQVYSRLKKYDRLARIWEALVKSNPANMEYRKSLAGAYLFLNAPKEAIRVMQEAITVNPAFKTEGEQYIQELQKEL
ncbi:MAG TPA: O-antigen ligase family protein [Candidatus Paceibacterota bacterium]